MNNSERHALGGPREMMAADLGLPTEETRKWILAYLRQNIFGPWDDDDMDNMSCVEMLDHLINLTE